MGLVQCLVELYVGNALSQRSQLVASYIMAIAQAIDICKSVGEENSPIKVKFIKDANEFIEFKNNAYLKWEQGR